MPPRGEHDKQQGQSGTTAVARRGDPGVQPGTATDARGGLGELMADLYETEAVGRIAAASREMWSQGEGSLRRSRDEARLRQRRALFEDLIAALEARNLDGNRCIDRMLRGWVRRVGAEFGIPVPRNVVRARNTARLHGALLDWMGGVIDDFVPEPHLQAADSAA